MKRIEGLGLGLAAAATLAIWLANVILARPATQVAGRHIILHFFGFSRQSICGWVILIGLLGGALGLALLTTGLIGRIPKVRVRETSGWIAFSLAALVSPLLALSLFFAFLIAAGIGDQTRFEADDGQSVVLTQDGYDGDSVSVYTEHGSFHYVYNRRAGELSGFPRVKDQACELIASEGTLLLTCETGTVTINP